VIETLTIKASRQGLHEITGQVEAVVRRAGLSEGLCTIFVQHTSASLIIQENADPSARADLENWLNRLVPAVDELFTHTTEGADDMPAHIKSALTGVSISVPIADGQMTLGAWQGIYLWEHRHGRAVRKVVVHVGG
jgi:secondary thiamine-phosphate synthase enzyme